MRRITPPGQLTDIDMDDYVLRGGDQGAERLRLLSDVKWPTTKRLLRRVGICKGMNCHDVGCGIGTVTLKMAKRVGSSGKVVGIDQDRRSLELARQAAQQDCLSAEFRVETISSLADESSYDLVYSRFLLSHLRKPELALERMRQAARPGASIVVEDIDFNGHFAHPICPAFDRYVELYQKVVARKGGDANIGPRLFSLFCDLGITQVQFRVVQPTFADGPGRQIAQVTMTHIREAVVAEELATPAEIDAIVSELDEFARNRHTILSMPRFFQVWGCR